MAHTSPLTGSRLPDLADAPNGPQAFSNSTLDLEDNVVVRCTSASDRDAKFSTWTAAGNTLTSGLTAFTQNDGRYWQYDTASSSWLYAGGKPPPIAAVSAGAGWNLASRAPGCYRDSSGLVHAVGGVAPVTGYNPQDGGTHTAAQFPTGYRPSASVDFTIPIGSAFLTAECRSDGIVYIIGGSTTSVAAAGFHSLESLVFHPGYGGSVPLS